MFISRTCLGADISGNEIRITELRRAGRKYEVLQAARIFASSAEPLAVASALQEFLVETQTRTANVVCSLPASICSIKFARVPPAKPADLAKIVRFEAESQGPLPLSEVVWDYAADASTSPGERHVVIASVRKSIAEELLAAMAAARIHPSALMVSSLAAVRSAASGLRFEEPVLLVDLGSEWCDMCVVDDGQVYGAHSTRLGCCDLMDAVIQDYGVGAEEARRMICERQMDFTAGIDAGDQSPTACAVVSWVERLAGEIGRSVMSLTAKCSERRPRNVVVIGSGAGVPGIAEALARWSGLPVEIGDPWNGMRVSMVCSLSVREPEAVYAAATGLAIAGLTGGQSINLLPRHAIEERRQRRKATAVLAGLGALAALLLVCLVVGASGVHARTKELQDLKARTGLAQQKVRRLTPELRAEAASVKRMAADIAREKPSCLEFLRLASANLPRSVWLSDLSFEAGKSVVLKGGALSNSAVADAVDSLASLELFDSLSLDYSSLSREGGSQNYEFQITCVLPASTVPSGRAEGKTSGRAASNARTGIIVQ